MNIFPGISSIKHLLFFALFVSGSTLPSELAEEITNIAAQHRNCNRTNSCLITVHEKDHGYSVHVRRSLLVTDHWVLKFPPLPCG